MSDESQGIDPYEAILVQLYAQRAQIDDDIEALEAMKARRAGGAGATSFTKPESANTGIDGPGALLGLSIVDAAKKILATKRQPLRNPEFAALFKAGGLVLNSREPANTIGSVLTRRFAEVGDVVRVDRGTWGLKEWYPGRSFKKDKTEGSDKDDNSKQSQITAESLPGAKKKTPRTASES